MKEFIRIYEENKEDIEKFILATLRNNSSTLLETMKNRKKTFQAFPLMELIYMTDLDFNQTTPNIYKNKIEESEKGKNRSYMNSKVLKKDEEFSISSPYISSATGRTCITIMKKEGQNYIFIDFKLTDLLGKLGLVELNPSFNDFTKAFYKTVGFSLMGLAFIAIFYALVGYLVSVFVEGELTLDSLFKPIVSLTLGLAIFDLAKTILEREVFFKNYSKDNFDSNVLTKFSIAIIIALSIEALMVVFKIALHDYSQMIHALYLIIGIALIILSLGVYGYLSKKASIL